jgi:RHS repeat-associated protein
VVITANDYYPFGMMMPGRKYSSDGTYRYGFNGKEKDSDINTLTVYDYGFRIYNPALGKFLSVDPLFKSYPWNSPYAYAENEPIANVDLDGLEKLKTTFFYNKNERGEMVASKSPETVVEDPNAFEPSTVYHLSYGGRDYVLNSRTTLQGRDPQRRRPENYERRDGDFTGVRSISNDELGHLIAFGLGVISESGYWFFETERTARDETINTASNHQYGLLDYKIIAYDLLQIDTDMLLEINGITYDPNEAGNYLWAMVLEYAGIWVDPAEKANEVIQETQGHPQDRAENRAARIGGAMGKIFKTAIAVDDKGRSMLNAIRNAIKRYKHQAKSEVKEYKRRREASNGTRMRDENITR